MPKTAQGKVLGALGGLFEIEIGGQKTVFCRARGSLRRGEGCLSVGDLVTLQLDEEGKGETVVTEILPRKNALIRPPVSNLDTLFCVVAAENPAPILETVDKLLAIMEHEEINCAVVLTKTDLSQEKAAALSSLYRNAHYEVYPTSVKTGEGLAALKSAVLASLAGGKCAVFSGASGVGKSSLLNSLFPSLALETGDVSRKTARGKNTTRSVRFYPVAGGYLGDTPGFSMLDFLHFDFMKEADLPYAFRDVSPFVGKCRYVDCTHVREGEEDCAVLRAVGEGKIEKSRHASYASLLSVLQKKKDWDAGK